MRLALQQNLIGEIRLLVKIRSGKVQHIWSCDDPWHHPGAAQVQGHADGHIAAHGVEFLQGVEAWKVLRSLLMAVVDTLQM